MTNDNASPVTWWIEFENGGRSTTYASEAEAWGALVDLQSQQEPTTVPPNRPAWLVASDGLRFAFPAKSTG